MFIDIGTISDHVEYMRLTKKDDWAVAAVARAVEGQVVSLDALLNFTIQGLKVIVECELKCTVQLPCARCIADLSVDITGVQELIYMPAAPKDANGPQSVAELDQIKEEIELESDDLDVGWYYGSKLDVSAVLCEATVLVMPMRTICGMANAKRMQPGECRTYQKKQPKMTHKPFANLKLP